MLTTSSGWVMKPTGHRGSDGPTGFRIETANGGGIAEVWGYDEETQAIARMMTAAPEMKKALDEMICHRCNNRIGWTGPIEPPSLGNQRGDYTTCSACEPARAALDKALGHE